MGITSMEQLKVSTKSNPNSVAGAMAGVLRQDGCVEVQIVGAGALNQAIKAVAIARGYVAAGGIDLVCVPTFADIEIDGERRTAIRLLIEDRHRRPIDEHAIPDGVLEEFVASERARDAAKADSNGNQIRLH
jgi:stage V sporulation protein S